MNDAHVERMIFALCRVADALEGQLAEQRKQNELTERLLEHSLKRDEDNRLRAERYEHRLIATNDEKTVMYEHEAAVRRAADNEALEVMRLQKQLLEAAIKKEEG